jgi:hypothetical protein
MPVSTALRGIPKESIPAALNAYAESIYKQAHSLLRDLRSANTDDVQRIAEELHDLQVDAVELLQLNVLSGFLPSKMKFISGIHLPREQAIQRFLARHNKPINQNGNSTNRPK